MPRQNRRRHDEPADTDAGALGHGPVRRESGVDGEWLVRPVTGAAATKTYRCPGCDQEIRPATPHVVVWPDYTENVADAPGLSDRRHWHATCWNARSRRRPGYWRR